MNTLQIRQIIREEIIKELDNINSSQIIDSLTEATEIISMVANQLKSKSITDLAEKLTKINFDIQDVQNSLTTEPYIG